MNIFLDLMSLPPLYVGMTRVTFCVAAAAASYCQNTYDSADSLVTTFMASWFSGCMLMIFTPIYKGGKTMHNMCVTYSL